VVRVEGLFYKKGLLLGAVREEERLAHTRELQKKIGAPSREGVERECCCEGGSVWGSEASRSGLQSTGRSSSERRVMVLNKLRRRRKVEGC
jgi:hypothetical protein